MHFTNQNLNFHLVNLIKYPISIQGIVKQKCSLLHNENKTYVIKSFISTLWIQPKHPFINENALYLTKNLVSIPWIQPKSPFINENALA